MWAVRSACIGRWRSGPFMVVKPAGVGAPEPVIIVARWFVLLDWTQSLVATDALPGLVVNLVPPVEASSTPRPTSVSTVLCRVAPG
jgi:hypothetical protein